MKTPEEFREHFAKESKYLNWNEMWMDSNETIQLENDIMQSYADYVTSEKDKEIARLNGVINDLSNGSLNGKIITQGLEQIRKQENQLESQSALLKEAKEALDDLMTWQNGSPLPSYDKGWNNAMEKGEQLLSKLNQE